MANSYANQTSGVGDTNPSKKKPSGKSPAKVTFTWDNGTNGHSISQRQHAKNVQTARDARVYGGIPGMDPTAVKGLITGAVDQKYGQPILDLGNQIAQSQQRSNVDIPAWDQQYIDALNAARGQAATAYQVPGAAVAAPALTGDPVRDQAAANQ